MRKIYISLAIGVILFISMVMASTSAPHATAATVFAILQPGNPPGQLLFAVSSDGDYLLNQSGNNPAKQLKATASGGWLVFHPESGNNAFQLVGVETASLDPVWTPCSGTKDGWFCRKFTTFFPMVENFRPVTAQLLLGSSSSLFTFRVSSDGPYLLLIEGGTQLKATATNGFVQFVTSDSHSFKLVGVIVTSLDPKWVPCQGEPGQDGWFCLQ